ncbi:hypothetical protein YC2023_060558 [Brassica napus]
MNKKSPGPNLDDEHTLVGVVLGISLKLCLLHLGYVDCYFGLSGLAIRFWVEVASSLRNQVVEDWTHRPPE